MNQPKNWKTRIQNLLRIEKLICPILKNFISEIKKRELDKTSTKTRAEIKLHMFGLLTRNENVLGYMSTKYVRIKWSCNPLLVNNAMSHLIYIMNKLKSVGKVRIVVNLNKFIKKSYFNVPTNLQNRICQFTYPHLMNRIFWERKFHPYSCPTSFKAN